MDDTGAKERHALRTKLVQLAFRQTQRDHAIPGDWMDCMVLRGRRGDGTFGEHVHFVVNEGGESLLPYLRAFEASFTRNLGKLDKSAKDWLYGMAWVLNDAPVLQAPPDWRFDDGLAAQARAARVS